MAAVNGAAGVAQVAQVGKASGGGAVRGRGIGSDNTFANTLKAALGDVQKSQDDAQNIIGQYLRGEPVELHRVMAAVEEAGLQLEMLVEVRNKMTEAYRAVIQMQN